MIESQEVSTKAMLLRVGTIPVVVRGRWKAGATDSIPAWGNSVVVETDAGEQLAEVVAGSSPASGDDSALVVLRSATDEDSQAYQHGLAESQAAFAMWEGKIAEWGLKVQLVDVEKSLDGTWILYVLTGREGETSLLAIQSKVDGLGRAVVREMDADGVISTPERGSCGSGAGGCGCHN